MARDADGYFVSLSDADAATLASVGPKAATLARLAHAGLRVPDAVCLTADAYRAHMSAFGLESAAAAVAGAADTHQARRLARPSPSSGRRSSS